MDRTKEEPAMSLQARLDAFKADFRAGRPPYNVPPSVIETMDRATNELIASGAAQRVLKAGDNAPEFALAGPDGEIVASRDLLAKGPLIVSLPIRLTQTPTKYGVANPCRKDLSING